MHLQGRLLTASLLLLLAMACEESRPEVGPARLRIDSDVRGAKVTLDGKVLAQKTPTTVIVEPGKRHELVVELDGQAPWKTAVIPEPGEARRVFARFQREEAAAALPVAKPPPAPAEEGPKNDVEAVPAKFTFVRAQHAVNLRAHELKPLEGAWARQVKVDLDGATAFHQQIATGRAYDLSSSQVLYARVGKGGELGLGVIPPGAAKFAAGPPARPFLLVDEDSALQQAAAKVNGVLMADASLRVVTREKRFRVRQLQADHWYSLEATAPESVAIAVACTASTRGGLRSAAGPVDPVLLLARGDRLFLTGMEALWCAMLDVGPNTAPKVELSVLPSTEEEAVRAAAPPQPRARPREPRPLCTEITIIKGSSPPLQDVP